MGGDLAFGRGGSKVAVGVMTFGCSFAFGGLVFGGLASAGLEEGTKYCWTGF